MTDGRAPRVLRIPVVRTADLAPGRTAKFAWEDGGRRRQGFVVNYRGTLRAYVNECAHIPMGLDWLENELPGVASRAGVPGDSRCGSGEFFDDESRYLVCATHGALYEPDTGYCVSGPSCGASLEPLRVEVEGEELVVYVEVTRRG